MTGSCERRQYLDLEVVFASDQLRSLFQQAERVAGTAASILITGESGTGKEMIARAIHHHSQRRSQSWVDINCTALPEHLLESELFGHEKGAFSGAASSKAGLFELAHKGTLFLDEIGDLDPRVQSKLLRVLDGTPYFRVGGVKKVSVDVRVVTATNRDLDAAAAQNTFRLDLYHRLSQIKLTVPPLRERPDDIAPLAYHFLSLQRPGMSISPEALTNLAAYSWPGNVRELRNVMIRAAVFAENTEITPADLPANICSGAFSGDLHRLSKLGEAERDVIVKVLDETHGHQRRAAAKLGISRRTLQRRIKSYGLEFDRTVSTRSSEYAETRG